MPIMSYESLTGLINENVQGLNDRYATCYNILGINPFDSGSFDIINTAASIVQGTALALTTLFFLIEFFKKTMDFQWIKWENVLMLLLKFIFAKVLVDNSVEIMKGMYYVLNSIALSVGTPDQFIPCDPANPGLAVSQFLTQSEILTLSTANGWLEFAQLFKWLELFPSFMIMQLILAVVQVVIFARMFELVVYTIASPIPLSSFASGEFSDIGKAFFKSFAAVCLQAFVIVVMFTAFTQLGNVLNQTQYQGILSGSGGIMVKTITFGLAVFKSGSWAKKLCGATM